MPYCHTELKVTTLVHKLRREIQNGPILEIPALWELLSLNQNVVNVVSILEEWKKY